MRRIKINKELCMSCLNCSIACMAEHNERGKSIFGLKLDDPRNETRSHISINSKKEPIPLFCRHCDEPECVYTCMSGAMQKDLQTGFVIYNKDQCASCLMCVMSCPYGILKADDRTKKEVVKCDMCPNRQIPRCVENCPTGAIYLEMEVV